MFHSKYFFLASISPTVVVILHMLQGLWFFPNFNWWLAKRLLEANWFWTSKTKKKHLVFFPKIEDLFSPLQTPNTPYTPNCKPSKCPHCHENPREYPKHLLLPLTYAFVIKHILPKLPWPICDVAPSSSKPCVALSCGWIPWMACLKHYEISQCVLLLHYCYPRTSKAFFETTFTIWSSWLKLCFLDDANIWDFNLKVWFETSCVFLVLKFNKLWHFEKLVTH